MQHRALGVAQAARVAQRHAAPAREGGALQQRGGRAVVLLVLVLLAVAVAMVTCSRSNVREVSVERPCATYLPCEEGAR